MKRKRRRGRGHRERSSGARPTKAEIVLPPPDRPRPSRQVIERSPAARVSGLVERHRYALADVKRSLVIGGAMSLLLVVLYLVVG